MLNADQGWKIKILSGLHAGAELVLLDEATTLGRGEECDLALDDPGLAETHIQLTPTAQGLRLSPLVEDPPTLLDGKALEGSVDLEPYQVIGIGGLHLAVGPAGGEWPAIEIPEQAPAEVESPEQANAVPSTEPSATGEAKSQLLAGWPLARFAVFAAGAAILAGIAIAWLAAPKEVPHRVADAGDIKEVIERAAQDLGAHVNVTFPEGSDALPKVSGFTFHEEDRIRFEQALKDAGIGAQVDLMSNSEVLHAVTALLYQLMRPGSKNSLQAYPSRHSPGHIEVRGYVESQADLKAVKRSLERGVHRHRGFSYSVQTRQDREETLRKRLAELQLPEALRIQSLNGEVALFGPAPEKDKLAELQSLVAEFNAEFDSRPSLTLPGTSTFLGKSTIEVDFRALAAVDGVYHLIDTDGNSRFVGDLLMGHWTISAIDPRYIILEQPSKPEDESKNGAQNTAYFIIDEA